MTIYYSWSKVIESILTIQYSVCIHEQYTDYML